MIIKAMYTEKKHMWEKLRPQADDTSIFRKWKVKNYNKSTS